VPESFIGHETLLIAESFCVCLAACLCAFESLPTTAVLVRAGRLKSAIAGLPVGAAVWAQLILGSHWPPCAAISPAYALAALAVSAAGSAWAFRVFDGGGPLSGEIGGAAILGLGAAGGHCVIMAGLRCPEGIVLDDAPIWSAIAFISSAAFICLTVARRWPVDAGKALAAIGLASGIAASETIARQAIDIQWAMGAMLGAGLAPIERLGPLAGALALAIVVCARFVAKDLSRATTAPDARESWRLFPTLRLAGTASPRPATARSAADQAASPGRPVPPER
jgi:NO-binding membrane sensor protein with MHYT domain